MDEEICIPMFSEKTEHASCSRHCPNRAKGRYKDNQLIIEELARV